MISKTFCAAPWTVHNTNADGSKSICCLNQTTKYEGDHLTWARSAAIQEVKRRMIDGLPVIGCEKCYAEEAVGTHSLRMLYNERTGSNLNLRHLRDPLYSQLSWFDTSISNRCNQKCRICGPYNSTAWYKDAAAFDDLIWAHSRMPSQALPGDRQHTVAEILAQMQGSTTPLIVEMKGGEPLYSAENQQLLAGMVESGIHERTQELRIITNGTQTRADLLQLIRQFPAIDLAISIDATGKLHEYTRGSNLTWDQCRARWAKLAALPNIKRLRIANTVYAYTIFDLCNLRQWVSVEFGPGLLMSDSMLRYPRYLHAKLIPDELRAIAARRLSQDDEMRRILTTPAGTDDFGDAMPIDQRLTMLRERFKVYTLRLDRLRGENIRDLVPEVASLLE